MKYFNCYSYSVRIFQVSDAADGKSGDVMTTSASFPDMSRLTDTPAHDHPRLVEKIPHSMVR